MKSIVLFETLEFTFFTLLTVVEMRMEYNTVPEVVYHYNKPFIPEVISKTCLLIPEPGPCRANVRMYYFDPSHGSCNASFSWGGCQGNGNRFESIQECEDKCLSKNNTTTIRPRYCFLSFDYGFCFGAAKRYYYNHIWKTCRETIYSGCGGNKNNFYSLEQCESICRFGHGPLQDETKRISGATKKILIINPPYTTPSRGKNQGKEPTNSTESNVSTAAVSRVYISSLPPGQGGI